MRKIESPVAKEQKKNKKQEHLDCLLNVKYATCPFTLKFSIVKQH